MEKAMMPIIDAFKSQNIYLKRYSEGFSPAHTVIVPIETNYLLNPNHPDFSRLNIGDARAFAHHFGQENA